MHALKSSVTLKDWGLNVHCVGAGQLPQLQCSELNILWGHIDCQGQPGKE
jgi:hypothetical protein